MHRFFKTTLSFFIFLLFFSGLFFLIKSKNKNVINDVQIESFQTHKEKDDRDVPVIKKEIVSPEKEEVVFKNVLLEVPFVLQAPSGNWENPFFQNGCEEVSVIMAMGWIKRKIFSIDEAEKEILKISAWEEGVFGHAVDTSVEDTAKIIREYYNHDDVKILKNITVDDIKKELMSGRLLIVPMDGKILNNPHYTPPGPDEHMLVVLGYDNKTDEFITNDPGTKFGKEYRYAAKSFFKAIWSYPSGSVHAAYPGIENAKKDMISIK
ncbi:MAG: hypothetical protein US25_C0005G0015 [Candidatus Moranbacteria bacterium GW2011_GWE1_36_7]|nr:MAG: hypothetical protein UR99_C0008G0007 [Candidatus Moranbacteria bacterium GW2011_GWD2_36_12]KKQ06841.1 MAG: hypothetical protein US16_C0008G0018 [Candidatus Moranbacteria bacterium GW2011_GWE2_36_40]KKQ15431.1 MAG: hypothetical protein US25_C0005G0015 [Candidatus Moranbacteria bacterium GW2011_GWE1_36_7]